MSFGVSFVLVISFLIITSIGICVVSAHSGVLNVKYKYAGQERSLTQLKAHDSRRQLRILAGVDLPLGGSGRPDAVGYILLFLLLLFFVFFNFELKILWIVKLILFVWGIGVGVGFTMLK
jgi:hypothetical protein